VVEQGALGAVGNNEGVVGLLRVASKHGLIPSPAMLMAAIEANPDPQTVTRIPLVICHFCNCTHTYTHTHTHIHTYTHTHTHTHTHKHKHTHTHTHKHTHTHTHTVVCTTSRT